LRFKASKASSFILHRADHVIKHLFEDLPLLDKLKFGGYAIQISDNREE
jgi:hypothetical protein